MQWIWGLIAALIPPVGSDPVLLARWRVKLAIVTISTGTLLVGFIAVAYGAVPGISGFAKADAIVAMQSSIDFIYKSELRRNIELLRQRQCIATDGLKQELSHKLSVELTHWQAMNHNTYPLLPCSDYQ